MTIAAAERAVRIARRRVKKAIPWMEADRPVEAEGCCDSRLGRRGHEEGWSMSKVQAGPIHADRLKSFIERIEKMEEERKAIGGDIRDIYSEAKGVGYDVKTMRRIVQLRRQDVADRDEAEALLDVYAHALGMVMGGASVVMAEPDEDQLLDMAAKVAGEVDRCMQMVSGRVPPKITAIQEAIGCSAGKAHKLRKLVVDRMEADFSRSSENDRENEKPPAQPDGPGSDSISCGGGESRPAGPKWRTPLVLPSEGSQAGSPPGEPGSVEGRADKRPPAGVAPGPQDHTNAAGRSPGDEGEDDDPRHLIAKPEVARPLPLASAWREITTACLEHEARKEAEREAARAKRRAAVAAEAAFQARVDADDLEIPAHLKRPRVALPMDGGRG